MILASGLAWALLRHGLTLKRIEGTALLAAYAVTLPMLLSS
jgi:cation:H+ antiporter